MKNEVDYRLCKWMIAGMKNDGIITKKEMLKIRNNIVEIIQPPFAEVEVNIKDIGDGITIGERKRKKKTIRVIEPKPVVEDSKNTSVNTIRVAAYARVSTDDDEQINSLEAQKDYYQNYISSHKNWEFVGIYADAGISGLSTNRRTEFKRLLNDCYSGKIDLIITKSVSRFARNTLDSISTIRTLKSIGVGVIFEKENIDTLDSKSEFILTIMSSIAQEESRSLAENVRWGQRKRFADGKSNVPYNSFIGYDKGENKFEMVINAEQAEVVKDIFYLYIRGFSPVRIAKELSIKGYTAPSSGKTEWHASTIRNILRNEKYKGDALLQKKFTVDYLTKKMKKNEGELPQYYIENDHEAIVSPWLFDYVQSLIEERRAIGSAYSCKHSFSGKVYCGRCGSFFSARPWHPESYNYLVWKCRNRVKNSANCQMYHIYDKSFHMCIYDSARQVALKRKIGKTIMVASQSVVDSEKLNMMKKWISKFKSLPTENLLSDDEDISIAIHHITVEPDHSLEITWLDDTKTMIEIKYDCR